MKLALIFLFTAANINAADVYFSPSLKCEDHIVEAFDESKKEVVAVVYSINNKRIISAIQRAKERGVSVRILTDNLQAAGRSSKVLELKNTGIDIRIHSKHKLEHNKFAWFDGTTAMNGSFNWTEPATKDNSENCVFFGEDEKNVITAFKDRFDTLWELNTEEKSQQKFARLQTKAADREIASNKAVKKKSPAKKRKKLK